MGLIAKQQWFICPQFFHVSEAQLIVSLGVSQAATDSGMTGARGTERTSLRCLTAQLQWLEQLRASWHLLSTWVSSRVARVYVYRLRATGQESRSYQVAYHTHSASLPPHSGQSK